MKAYVWKEVLLTKNIENIIVYEEIILKNSLEESKNILKTL